MPQCLPPAAAVDTGLLYRPDWPQVKKRLTALWEGQNTDRPGLSLTAPRPSTIQRPTTPDSMEALYLDPEYVAASWLAMMDSTHFLGEAVPVGGFLLGGYALGCGPNVQFDSRTVWHPHLDPKDWRSGPDDPWQQKMDRVVRRLMELAPGKFLVGAAGQLPVNDLLLLLIGSDRFLLKLADDLEGCRQLLQETWPRWHELKQHYLQMMLAQGQGCILNWPGLWHPKLMITTQSDMSCMISGEMFDRYVMPEMDLLGERCDFVWYHLDGSGAVRHLPKLLSRPFIRAIQYVPSCDDPPNGPGLMQLYRQVQAAGRCLDIQVPWENLEYLIRHLRPDGLLLRSHAPSREAAEELLAAASRWTGSDIAHS